MAWEDSERGDGRLGPLHLRVGDAARAARFFSGLLGAGTERKQIGRYTEQRIITRSDLVEQPIDAVLTDDETAPAARLCFLTTDPVAALARTVALGVSGADIAHARDNQGVPLAFSSSAEKREEPQREPTHGALGVVIVQVHDTGKAWAFYRQLFGQEFHRVGSGGDCWWVSSGPALGVFPAVNDVINPQVPRLESDPEIRAFFCVGDLEDAMTTVREPVGETLGRSRLGPYHVCDCRDDQSTRFGLWWDPKMKNEESHA